MNGDVCPEIPGIEVTVSDDHLRQRVRQEFEIDAINICNEKKEKHDDVFCCCAG